MEFSCGSSVAEHGSLRMCGGEAWRPGGRRWPSPPALSSRWLKDWVMGGCSSSKVAVAPLDVVPTPTQPVREAPAEVPAPAVAPKAKAKAKATLIKAIKANDLSLVEELLQLGLTIEDFNGFIMELHKFP